MKIEYHKLLSTFDFEFNLRRYIQGGVVSAFGRSVQSHLRALFRENKEGWSAEASQRELEAELKQRRLQKEAQDAARAAAAGGSLRTSTRLTMNGRSESVHLYEHSP